MDQHFKKIINIQNHLYNICGFKFSDLIAETESAEYCAHIYTIENKSARFRISKKTPTKTGQFVTMWKRIPTGIIAPYDKSDSVDLLVINLIHNDKIGHFVFPKSVLIANNIFSVDGKGGKRAIRIYAPWDEANSIQAKKTKEWQIKYFVDITSEKSIDINQMKKLYSL